MKQHRNWSRSRRSSSSKLNIKKAREGKQRKNRNSNYSSCNTSSQSPKKLPRQPQEGRVLNIIQGLEDEQERQVLSRKMSPFSHLGVQQLLTIKEDPNHSELMKFLQYNKHYHEEFQQSLINENVFIGNSLQNQRISYQQRARMVDWMIEVFGKYHKYTSDATFFRSVSIMDYFLQKSITEYTCHHLHLIGITSMFIATKIEDRKCISLQEFATVISRNKCTTSKIKEMEQSILETLNFEITFPTSLDYLKNIFYECFSLNDNPTLQHILQASIYTLKMSLHDYLMTSFNSYTLASSVFLYCINDLVLSNNLMNQEFIINQFINKVVQISQIDQREINLCQIQIKELLSTFNIKYPTLKNLFEFQ